MRRCSCSWRGRGVLSYVSMPRRVSRVLDERPSHHSSTSRRRSSSGGAGSQELQLGEQRRAPRLCLPQRSILVREHGGRERGVLRDGLVAVPERQRVKAREQGEVARLPSLSRSASSSPSRSAGGSRRGEGQRACGRPWADELRRAAAAAAAAAALCAQDPSGRRQPRRVRRARYEGPESGARGVRRRRCRRRRRSMRRRRAPLLLCGDGSGHEPPQAGFWRGRRSCGAIAVPCVLSQRLNVRSGGSRCRGGDG
jgi:hypothetical protein